MHTHARRNYGIARAAPERYRRATGFVGVGLEDTGIPKGLFGFRGSRGDPGLFPGRTNHGPNCPGTAHVGIWLHAGRANPAHSTPFPGRVFPTSIGRERFPRLGRSLPRDGGGGSGDTSASTFSLRPHDLLPPASRPAPSGDQIECFPKVPPLPPRISTLPPPSSFL
jgi:hypothetical protein